MRNDAPKPSLRVALTHPLAPALVAALETDACVDFVEPAQPLGGVAVSRDGLLCLPGRPNLPALLLFAPAAREERER